MKDGQAGVNPLPDPATFFPNRRDGARALPPRVEPLTRVPTTVQGVMDFAAPGTIGSPASAKHTASATAAAPPVLDTAVPIQPGINRLSK